MVDANTGTVFSPPFDRNRNRSMQLRLEIWSAPPPDRATCGVSHLNWTGKKFDVVKFQHVQPKY